MSYKLIGKNAIAIATPTAGNKLATLTFLPHTKFSPTQKINTFPTVDKLNNADSVIKGSINLASNVMLP